MPANYSRFKAETFTDRCKFQERITCLQKQLGDAETCDMFEGITRVVWLHRKPGNVRRTPLVVALI